MRDLSKHFRRFNKKLTKNLGRFLENRTLVGFFFGALVFGFKLPFVNLPFWWDEGNYLEGALKILQNNLNPFVEWWSYKPFLIYEMTALGFHFFGFSRIIPRLIIILFSFLTLYFTFLLGDKLYNKKVGFFASFLLFLSPLFFAQSALFHADLPLAALTLIVLYCFLSEKKIGYFVAASLVVLIKEAGVLVILAILAYESLFNFRRIFSRQFILKFLFLASPLLFFLGWMVLNKRYLGWYLWPFNVNYFSLTSFLRIEKLLPVLNFAFWRDFRFLFTLPLLTGFILSFFSKDLKKWLIKKEVALFFLFTIVSIVFFWWGPFLPRYLLIFQPLFFIVSVATIFGICKKINLYLPIVLAIGLLFISSWFSAKFEWGGEANLNYLQGIRVHREMTQYLSGNFPSHEILTTWPMNSELSAARLGFINRPFSIIRLHSISEERKEVIAVISKSNMAWQKDTEELLVFLQKKGVTEQPLAVFKGGGEEISIYLLTPENR